MTYTLTMCIGMFLSICGSITTSTHATLDDCRKEREVQIAMSKRIVYATCSISKVSQ